MEKHGDDAMAGKLKSFELYGRVGISQSQSKALDSL